MQCSFFDVFSSCCVDRIVNILSPAGCVDLLPLVPHKYQAATYSGYYLRRFAIVSPGFNGHGTRREVGGVQGHRCMTKLR